VGGVEAEKTPVQVHTFFFEDAYLQFYACRCEPLDTLAIHLRKGVTATYDDAGDAFCNDEIGTWWGLTMVGTRFEGYIKRRMFDERDIDRVDRRDAVDFGVRLAILFVIAFPDDAILMYKDRADHGVWCGVTSAQAGQLEAPVQVCFYSDQGVKILILDMDWMEAQKQMVSRLSALYGDGEAAAIAELVLEALSGRRWLERRSLRAEQLAPEVVAKYGKYADELLAHRPVQYVLGEAWFGGMRFHVDERVLIPRPETEELVAWVAEEASGGGGLLDVGTGSGCIAVTLARRLPGLEVHACDISEGALAVARQNAGELGARVQFFESDFLDRVQWGALPPLRWLVSNPPYVPDRDKEAMDKHVVGYEPSLALFVPDEDALVFYRALGEFAGIRLAPGGALYAEIHEDMGAAVKRLLLDLGAREVIIRKDMQEKDRMVKAFY
jgi:release factor glutamine methyltransferase